MKWPIAAILFVMPLSPAGAQLGRFQVSRIAHSTEALPGSPVFERFDTALIDQGLISFVTVDQGANNAIFASSAGQITLVAGLDTLIPGTSRPFERLHQPSVSAGQIVFSAGAQLQDRGVYRWSAGDLMTVQSMDSSSVQIHDGLIAAMTTNSDALYRGSPSGLTRFADRSTPAPTEGDPVTFDFFYEIAARNDTVAFIANDSAPGITRNIYQHGKGGFELAAYEGMPVPGGSASFTSFNHVQLSDTALFFQGRWSSGGPPESPGIFAKQDDELFRLVDATMIIPGTSRRISGAGFGGMAVSDDDLLFTSGSGSGSGGYEDLLLSLDLGESLVRVASQGDLLDGRVIDGLRVAQGGISGDSFVFVAHFTDGTSGVYAATIPVPSVAIVMLGVLVPGIRRARR